MKPHRHATLVIAVALTSVGFAWAQQSSPPVASDSNRPQKPRALITVHADSQTPFVLNQAVAAELVRADEQLAADALGKIKQDITELVTRYPESPAAKEMAEILDKAGLKVIPTYGVYAKSVICITVPITR